MKTTDRLTPATRTTAAPVVVSTGAGRISARQSVAGVTRVCDDVSVSEVVAGPRDVAVVRDSWSATGGH